MLEEFLQCFQFSPVGSFLVGVERECFLTDKDGEIAPLSPQILLSLPDRARFGYELSACQLEDRVGPCELKDIKDALLRNEEDIGSVESKLGFKRLFCEVGPSDMPLDVYPDPTGRYQQIVKNLPPEILLAACRVIGTHIHIGMPNHETALKVYNQVIVHWERLCQLGDGSNGQRLEIYKMMAPDFRSPHYSSWQNFYEEAVSKGFVSDPRRCWHLIRLSVRGTIEFRMFGVTADLDKIVDWARICYHLCKQAVDN